VFNLLSNEDKEKLSKLASRFQPRYSLLILFLIVFCFSLLLLFNFLCFSYLDCLLFLFSNNFFVVCFSVFLVCCCCLFLMISCCSFVCFILFVCFLVPQPNKFLHCLVCNKAQKTSKQK
jgi:hypothetical protein